MQLATRAEYEGAQEENNTHRGQAVVLATAKARVACILSGPYEPPAILHRVFIVSKLRGTDFA